MSPQQSPRVQRVKLLLKVNDAFTLKIMLIEEFWKFSLQIVMTVLSRFGCIHYFDIFQFITFKLYAPILILFYFYEILCPDLFIYFYLSKYSFTKMCIIGDKFYKAYCFSLILLAILKIYKILWPNLFIFISQGTNFQKSGQSLQNFTKHSVLVKYYFKF